MISNLYRHHLSTILYCSSSVPKKTGAAENLKLWAAPQSFGNSAGDRFLRREDFPGG